MPVGGAGGGGSDKPFQLLGKRERSPTPPNELLKEKKKKRKLKGH
jgi:hypothetical protein